MKSNNPSNIEINCSTESSNSYFDNIRIKGDIQVLRDLGVLQYENIGIITKEEENKEGYKMAEGQSRYGIMEELNNRKITQKEKLANIEREADQHKFDEDRKIEQAGQKIKDKTSTYKLDYKGRQRTRNVQLNLLEGEYKREKKELEDSIKDDNDNYEQRFKAWKEEQEKEIVSLKDNLKRYDAIQGKKIEEKEEIIAEIENGIKSLKEISSEQKEEKK